MYLGVKTVAATDGHRLLIEFEGGEVRSFDVAPLLGIGRFRELASLDVFKTARVAFDTVQWDNGLDLDPEYLYERSKPLPCEHAASEDGRSSWKT